MLIRKIFLLLVCLLTCPAAFAGEEISENTRKKVKALFGNKKLFQGKNISVRLNSAKMHPGGEIVVYGPYVDIGVRYKGRVRSIRLVAVFLDGNRRSLVAKLIPGESAPIREYAFHVQAMPDDYCDSRYRVVVVMQVKRRLLSKVVPIHVVNPDCG